MKSEIAKLGLVLAVYTLSGCSGLGLGALVGSGIADGIALSRTVDMVRDSMPVDYHGLAEREIKSGKYDPKLWAEALVLVEGNERKRYAKYIDLRADQLKSKNTESTSILNKNDQPVLNVPSVPNVQPLPNEQPALAFEITGTYFSDITGLIGVRAHNSLIIFRQSGNNIIGTNVTRKDNDIIGIQKGDTIKFKYWTQWRELTGVWKVNSGGTRLEGTWENIDSYEGKWNLWKMQ